MTVTMSSLQTSDRRNERRKFDRGIDAAQPATPPVRVLPGEHYISENADETIVTILGSCIAACIRDPIAGVGGMNHFMLPQSEHGRWGGDQASLRYGNFAMERLINDLLMRGAKRERLEIKVFGGANVMNNGANIGWQNADFVEDYLEEEGLEISARHLRGAHPRRIHYNVATGKVQMLELRRSEEVTVVASEARYERTLSQTTSEGSIDLFEDEPVPSLPVLALAAQSTFGRVLQAAR